MGILKCLYVVVVVIIVCKKSLVSHKSFLKIFILSFLFLFFLFYFADLKFLHNPPRGLQSTD